MSLNAAVTRKISFQTTEMEISLTEVEYAYLKFICEATLRDSDEVLREQIRTLQVAGLPTFDEWRQQQPTPAAIVQQTIAFAPVLAEVTAISQDPIAAPDTVESSGSTVERGAGSGRREAKAELETDETAMLIGEIVEPASDNGTGSSRSQQTTPSALATRSKRGAKAEAETANIIALPAAPIADDNEIPVEPKPRSRRKTVNEETPKASRSERTAKTALSESTTAAITPERSEADTVAPELQPKSRRRTTTSDTPSQHTKQSAETAAIAEPTTAQDTSESVTATPEAPANGAAAATLGRKPRRKSSSSQAGISRRGSKRKAATPKSHY